MHVSLKIGQKLVILFSGIAISITLILSVIIYLNSSASLTKEASAKLASVAELKTQTIEKFMDDRYGDIHTMT